MISLDAARCGIYHKIRYGIELAWFIIIMYALYIPIKLYRHIIIQSSIRLSLLNLFVSTVLKIGTIKVSKQSTRQHKLKYARTLMHCIVMLIFTDVISLQLTINALIDMYHMTSYVYNKLYLVPRQRKHHIKEEKKESLQTAADNPMLLMSIQSYLLGKDHVFTGASVNFRHVFSFMMRNQLHNPGFMSNKLKRIMSRPYQNLIRTPLHNIISVYKNHVTTKNNAASTLIKIPPTCLLLNKSGVCMLTIILLDTAYTIYQHIKSNWSMTAVMSFLLGESILWIFLNK